MSDIDIGDEEEDYPTDEGLGDIEDFMAPPKSKGIPNSINIGAYNYLLGGASNNKVNKRGSLKYDAKDLGDKVIKKLKPKVELVFEDTIEQETETQNN